ncbi:MAG: glutamate-5-semialdehyde dehydrogenase [Defluviitaleaceae bacterium]|nr:glutamate-5-semialdehyde dehydrogenase [Defluviitaleaceae bacterium]
MESLDVIGRLAKEASKHAAKLATDEKNRLLYACADALEAGSTALIDANKKDMRKIDLSRTAFADRLLLTPARVRSLARAMRGVAGQNDPVNETIYMRTMPSGLEIGQKRTPIGVVAMIYEARPEVTTDAFALSLKAGNSCVLRGGSEAINTNKAIVAILHDTLNAAGHPVWLVQLITDTSRATAKKLMRMNEYIDVLFPRGGAGLIKAAVENSTIPVVETGVGNCHIFVDESANQAEAVKIIINAKTQRPSVCNACEKLLVHKAAAKKFLPLIGGELKKKNVEIRGDEKVCAIIADAVPATEDDWREEYLDLIIGVKVVKDVDEAIRHINGYGTGHSDAILTESYANAKKFTEEVDSAAVYVNASTRFTDGGEFGLGAEIGISTQKIHARGPMGLNALTSSKFVIHGSGQIRG